MKIFYLDYIHVCDFQNIYVKDEIVAQKYLLTKLDLAKVLNSGLRANYPYHGIQEFKLYLNLLQS